MGARTRPLMDQHRHKLTVTLSPHPIWLDADVARMEQVIANLLTNAAKYFTTNGPTDLLQWLRNQNETTDFSGSPICTMLNLFITSYRRLP